MRKRIYGLETEYGIVLIKKNSQWFSDRSILFPYLMHLREFSAGDYLANGSRAYVDLDFHPEYCTAECAKLSDLIAQDKAGEKILTRVFAEAIEGKEDISRILLSKNNCDYVPDDAFFSDDQSPLVRTSVVSFGCHENFLTDANLAKDAIAEVLIPFLVARPIISGAGWVAERAGWVGGPICRFPEQRYAISQRARFIGKDIGSATRDSLGSGTRPGWQRAIFCDGRWDEPLAHRDKYRRLHLILGDSNLSELSIYLKMGPLGILLEMLEERYPLDSLVSNFTLKNPVEALHLVSCDLTCKKPVIELSDGRRLSAIDLLWEYVKVMERYKRSEGLSEELSDVLKRLIDILQRFERRQIDQETLMEIDSQGLDEELDWLIKKSNLEYTLKKFDCHWNNFCEKNISSEEIKISLYDKIVAQDLKYHDISSQGLYNRYVAQPNLPLSDLRAFGIRTPRIVEKEEIENMKKNPPQDTRAKPRGEFIKFLEEKGIRHMFHIDWDHISATVAINQADTRVMGEGADLGDPFKTENRKIDSWKRVLN